jgi:hypothetical protein
MARKTNYNFERREREKSRAAKKAERQRLKQEKSDQRRHETDPAGEDFEVPDSPAESPPED